MVDRPKLPYPDGSDFELFYARFKFPNNRKIKIKSPGFNVPVDDQHVEPEELKT
jgi:hypothetical protein